MLLATTLQGCGMVRIAYNQAPDALYWWLDSYLDFREVQSLRLRPDLEALQQWHRNNELPAWVALLEKARTQAAGDIDGAQVCRLLDEGRARAIAVLERLEPTTVALAPTLTTEQISHLETQLDKRNRKWRAEWMEGPAGKRTAKRVKEAASRAEMFYGDLGDRQLALVRSAIARSVFDPQITYREALRREQDALGTLRSLQAARLSQAQVQAAMRGLFDRTLHSPDLAYRSYLQSLTQDGCSLIAELHNSATPAQRQRAMKTLKSYEDDFVALAAPR